MSYISFWNEFSKHADSWAKEMKSLRHRKVFDEIDSLLQAFDVDFCFDITTGENHCILIFSPEGQPDIAQSIDELVGHAPDYDTWKVLGRRPQKDLDDASAIVRNLYLLDPLELRYRIRDDELGRIVTMIVPSNADLTPEEAKGMVNTFLWHAIGEDRVIKQGIRGEVVFDDRPTEATISAAQLVENFG